jgi:hypothetical protein
MIDILWLALKSLSPKVPVYVKQAVSTASRTLTFMFIFETSFLFLIFGTVGN